MAVNKVIYGGRTLLDLSGDSLTLASQLRKGVKAHTKAGVQISGSAQEVITATNKSVSVAAWASDTTYADYPYRAKIAISGVTSAYTPYVFFADADADSRILCPVADSYNGGVYIYANVIPTKVVSVVKIECVEE